MWPDIIALRVVACMLAWSYTENILIHWKYSWSHSFTETSWRCSDKSLHCYCQWTLYSQESVDVETTVEASNETDEDFHSDSIEKRWKYYLSAEFCNLSSSDGIQRHSLKSCKDCIAEVDEEMRHYTAISTWSDSEATKYCKKCIWPTVVVGRTKIFFPYHELCSKNNFSNFCIYCWIWMPFR